MIGGNGFNSPKIAEIAGDAAEGTLVGSPWFIGKADPASQKFVEAYKAKYNAEPDQFAAQAYDTLFIVAKAINDAGAAEPEKIKDALGKVKYTELWGRSRSPRTAIRQRRPASSSSRCTTASSGSLINAADR